MSSKILVELDPPVARIQIARGAKRNAITVAMYDALATALADVGARDDVRIIVLSGSDGSFTAGNDLADMTANPDTGPASPPSRFLAALVALDQVLVVAVDGPAIGIGTTVLLHADLVYATRASTFAMPFVNLGLVPEAASTYLLPELVGHPVAAELLLLGRRFTAAEALSWKLVTDVVADEAALRARVDAVVAALAAQPSRALLSTRRLLRAHRQEPVRQRLDEDSALLRELASVREGGGMDLGSVGVWSIGLRGRDTGSAAAAAAELEQLGYTTLWFPAGAGRGFDIARALLAATTTTIVATGILSVWTQPPADVVEGFESLEQFAPGRFLLGLGVSHGPFVDRNAPGTYQRPLEKMREYLDALDAVPVDRRMLAALGPKMLELAATRTLGTHPYLVTAEHTARLRAALGPGPVLAAEQAVVVESDPATSRAVARAHLATYLSLPNYVNNWRRIGFDESDIVDGGSDRLVDALVAWGSAESIAARVREHHQAGADHVCIQVLREGDREALPLPQWRELAPALGL